MNIFYHWHTSSQIFSSIDLFLNCFIKTFFNLVRNFNSGSHRQTPYKIHFDLETIWSSQVLLCFLLFCLLATLPEDKMQKFSRSQLFSTSISPWNYNQQQGTQRGKKRIHFYLQSRAHFPSWVSCVSCVMCFNQPPRRSNWDLGT